MSGKRESNDKDSSVLAGRYSLLKIFILILRESLILRDNSSDPLSGDPDAVEWEKGFIEYAIENVSLCIFNKIKLIWTIRSFPAT